MNNINKNIAIVLGSFHKTEANAMLNEARATASTNGLSIVEEVWVPGSMEKPLVVKKLLQRNDIDGVAVLGIIERGETKHGLVMGQVVTDAIIRLQLEFMKPVGFGILGPEILPEQIQPRLKAYAKKAIDALASVLRVS